MSSTYRQVHVYTSADANAPVLASANVTSLINLLEKCLVSGYGDKQPAGWTMPFINTEGNIAAFRNNPEAGTGFFLRVEHRSNNSRYAQFFGYESMTSENDGLLPFGVNDSSFLVDSSVSNTSPRTWTLIANDVYLYFFISPNLSTSTSATREYILNKTSYRNTIIAFGDFESLFSDDNYNCMAMYKEPLTSYYFGSLSTPSNAWFGGHYVARKSTGAAGGIRVGASAAGPITYNTSYAANGGCKPFVENQSFLTSKILINDGEAYTARGFLPGLLLPLHYLPFENHEIVTLNGRRYYALIFLISNDTYTDRRGQFLFDLGPAEPAP